MLEKVLNKRYKIIKELGKGGMAIVYEAQDDLLDRKVALKMLRPEYINDKDFVKRFRHEAKAVARLSHPNVVNIFDIGQDGKYHYLVMEDVDGYNLKDIIKEKGRLDTFEALDIARQICAALIVAHNNNIIHCDIKPHNILLTPDKQVKVTDFGIARAATSSTLTITDTVVGSAHYFSPEQARGGEIKSYSDLYSLGIVIYEMLTGQVPFKGDSPISVALKHIQEKPKRPGLINPDIPEEVEKLVMRAIAKEPSVRFQNADEMKKSINKVIAKLKDNIKPANFVASDNDETKVLKRVKVDSRDKGIKTGSDEREYLSQQKERGKIAWVKWIVALVIFLAITGITMFIFYQRYMDVPVVEVPDIIGMNLQEAAKEAAQVGLQIEEQNEGVNHPEIPKGDIISQYPTGGERVRQTRVIMVTVSKGPARLKAPDFLGLTLREARVILDNNNLIMGKEEYIYSSEITEGEIVNQDPEPGEEIGVEEEIDFIISKGPEPNRVIMPELLGLSREKAVERIEAYNLTLGEINEEYSKRFKEGQVAKQQYSSGNEIAEGSKINITISKGLLNEDNADVHSGVFKIQSVPAGPRNQEIKIIIYDNNGSDLMYNKKHQPGDYIALNFNSVGPTIFEVYTNDQLWQEYKLGY
ncbi:Stk1 family PASTA domain-containing Ser/Thr kinase [Halocella sp. SP3-1]|uniref:Stk1 family PASTA domain-containing Ser/Thr kinase n=1 Tax=Halocella sp. SP3-1 TaxID=2382161 RepID=UPI000F758D90|nr:Stk1 family PASTA domain-containing Ser/Thr kinase [Halocella sp. SP3-1]AZO95218.1 Stk1 family PASTA domain-containing Ser/Thr kinase [Halocella sp. SP3-1]